MSKRGQGLPTEVIIIAVLALFVLLILGFVFTKGTRSFTNSTGSCQGKCIASGESCDGKITADRCPQPSKTEKQVCCLSAETLLTSP